MPAIHLRIGVVKYLLLRIGIKQSQTYHTVKMNYEKKLLLFAIALLLRSNMLENNQPVVVETRESPLPDRKNKSPIHIRWIVTMTTIS